jgi:hypothetical protein
MVGGPTSRLRLLFVDVVILILQLTMLAITATTTPKTPETGTTTTTTVARVAASAELDRAERGETEEEMTVQEGSEDAGSMATGFEHVVVSVGVVETIKSLWDDTTPLVRRFR